MCILFGKPLIFSSYKELVGLEGGQWRKGEKVKIKSDPWPGSGNACKLPNNLIVSLEGHVIII